MAGKRDPAIKNENIAKKDAMQPLGNFNQHLVIQVFTEVPLKAAGETDRYVIQSHRPTRAKSNHY
jgi:hypothetical protein